MPDEPGPVRRRGPANWILAGLIAGFGIMAFVVAVATGRADSALLFVGLPVTLAVALAVFPARTTHGRVFAATTIGVLLAAVALHEGAICVILAAPLIYLVAHSVTWVVTHLRRRYAVLLVPLLLVTGLEGADESLRVQPVHSVAVSRVVDLPADEVAARIAAGPRPVPVRSLPLRALRVPMPVHVTRDALRPEGGNPRPADPSPPSDESLRPGDRWRFGYHGTAHGPGGEITTEVRDSGPGAVTFAIVSDDAITARWFTWEAAEITWEAIDGGPAGTGQTAGDQTEVRVSATVTRGLDPSWYFGPIQDALLRQGLVHLLDMLLSATGGTATQATDNQATDNQDVDHRDVDHRDVDHRDVDHRDVDYRATDTNHPMGTVG